MTCGFHFSSCLSCSLHIQLATPPLFFPETSLSSEVLPNLFLSSYWQFGSLLNQSQWCIFSSCKGAFHNSDFVVNTLVSQVLNGWSRKGEILLLFFHRFYFVLSQGHTLWTRPALNSGSSYLSIQVLYCRYIKCKGKIAGKVKMILKKLITPARVIVFCK